MPLAKEKIKRILVVRNDRFGEFLLNIPAIRALKEVFSSAAICAAVNPDVASLAARVPYIGEIIEWAGSARHTAGEKLRLLKRLKEKRFDLSVILNPSKEFHIYSFLAGIPCRVGYDRKWGFLLTHRLRDEKSAGKKHEVEYNLDLVGLAGAKTADKRLSLTLENDIIINSIRELSLEGPERLIALHPWTSDSIKQWPLENFLLLAKYLSSRFGSFKIVIIGGKENLKRSSALFSGLNDNIVNLTGKTSLVQLAAVLKKCSLLISGDSGPVHLAAAVGTPVLAIFRNDIPGKSPQRWGPWGQGHFILAKADLSAITVEEVLEKSEEALGR